jgi:serine/threonine protein kinase
MLSLVCQDIVDQVVRIAHAFCDRDVLHRDARPANFIVKRVGDVDLVTDTGPGEEKLENQGKDDQRQGYRTVMIDFGQSRLRREDESDAAGGRLKRR